MRIVSFLSSATETVFALGLQEHLVGISHECDHPAEALGLPRVSRARFDPEGLSSAEIDEEVRRCMLEYGGVYRVDAALLARLAPDVVLTQAVCEVCAVPTGAVEETIASLPSAPRVVSLDAHTLEGILASVADVAEAVGARDRGEELASALRGRLHAVSERVAERARPGVLILEWLDPPFTAGHWVPEMVAAAGGQMLVGTPGERSREIGWDDLPRGADVLCIEPCGYDLGTARRDAEHHRGRLTSLAGEAIRNGRAWLLHSSFYSRSGPRVVEGVEVLARILHPGALPDVPIEGRAERWH